MDKMFTNIINNPLIHTSILSIVCIFLILCIYQFTFPIKEGLKKKNPFAAILKPITMIINVIKCTIRLVISIPKCFLYYMLDILGFMFYLPFSLLFWILGARKQEKQIWKGIYKIDSMIYNQSGYHIFHYSNSIMNKCYRCKPKKAKKNGSQTINAGFIKMEKAITGGLLGTKLTSESTGNAFLMAVIIIVSAFAIMYFAFSTFGITLFPTTISPNIGVVVKKAYDTMLPLVNPIIPERIISEPFNPKKPNEYTTHSI